MNLSSLSSETLHACCVAVNGRAVLIAGRSGSGKSDLALRLIDRGASLVSDDYTMLRRVNGKLLASAPSTIVGKMEVRGVGILSFDNVTDAQVCLFVDLDGDVERLPEKQEARTVAGVGLPVLAINGLEASAPVKVEVALRHLGLTPE